MDKLRFSVPGLEMLKRKIILSDRHMINLDPFADSHILIVLKGPRSGVCLGEVSFSSSS